ncbi:DUF305 domain-containing protein [Halomonas sp. MC140]|nr:DUF305 domain-containing protein [Halomonas sp. MC140]MDN7133196.1 DUF305 domain-containing protein [Halomonas sp. MC140]
MLPFHSTRVSDNTRSDTRRGIPVAAVSLMLVSLLVAPLSYAQHHEAEEQLGGHGQHEESNQQHTNDPAVAAYQAANGRMHEDMTMSFTGDPDVDFAQGMIPHHEGAIAMANIVLEYGEDEEIRQLAEEIIAAQENEIAFLREWLTQHGH